MNHREMKLVITGGAGFIGSHTAEYFARKGNEVTVIDNLSRARLLRSGLNMNRNWKYLDSVVKVKKIMGDVSTRPNVLSSVQDCDVVIHTAAQTAVTSSLVDPIMDMQVNLGGTINVLEAARKARSNPFIVFTSTNKVYGDNVNRIPISEDSDSYSFANLHYGVPEDFPIDRTGHTPYGSSKLAADIYVQDYAHTYGLKSVVFRMSCIYGTRQYGVEDQGWVAWFTFAVLAGKPVKIFGNGKQVRDILYVDDLVRGFDAAIVRAKKLKGEVFNIGGGPNNVVSLLQLLDRLEEFTSRRPRITFKDWRSHDQKVYVSDIRKAKTVLGWSPKVTIDDGIQKLVAWARSKSPLQTSP